jgi:hypothetical protein
LTSALESNAHQVINANKENVFTQILALAFIATHLANARTENAFQSTTAYLLIAK